MALSAKLQRIKQLIEERESLETRRDKIDSELAQLLGEAERPRRGRPKKDESAPANPEPQADA